MNRLKAVWLEGKTRWLQSFYSRPVRTVPDAPLVSISFDDVPMSTFHYGRPVLDRHGVKATFYVCLGMGNKSLFLGPREVRSLYLEGHEIGCHTYRHYRLTFGSARGMAADAKRNRDELAGIIDAEGPLGFSYPFGKICAGVKRRLGKQYHSLRSSRPGVNSGISDFNCLRAISLQAPSFSSSLVDFWLDEAGRRRGWLIFFTHAISPEPTRYDLTPNMLEVLLSGCLRRGYQILPVGSVARILTAQTAESK
jgi:peptidoglycan/xylan/chitin deacetylase (PgdA/CDA1 family)